MTSWHLVVLTFALTGCGGSIGGSSQASSGTSAKEEFEGLAAGIEADINDVLAPLDEADALLADIKTIKAELGASFDAAFSAAAGGQVNVDVQLDAAVQERLNALAGRAAQIAQKLEALPDECTKLISNLADRAAQVPQLAASATAEAQLTLNNPFASDGEKSEAQATATLVATLPKTLLSKVSAAKDRITTLPARAASALHELAVVAGISALTWAATAPSEGSGAASSAGATTGSDVSTSSAKKISPFLALDRAGPWIARGVARGRARLDRADAALESLREALSVSLPPRATTLETQARSERVNRRALEAQEASTALAQLSKQTTQLTAVIDDLDGRIPEIAVSAERWADHALADFGADAAYLARAEKQKRSVTRMQVEALVAIQLARHETSSWPAKIAELRTSSGTLLAQVTSLPAVEAKIDEPLIAAFPQVEAPPRAVEDPRPPQAAPIFVEPTPAQHDDASRADIPLIIAATLTTASLIAAIYTVDRVAASNSCFNAVDGYGCSNADSLESQMDTGRAMIFVFGTGALGALIWALVD